MRAIIIIQFGMVANVVDLVSLPITKLVPTPKCFVSINSLREKIVS